MAVRIARGFYRLWLVLSVIWIGEVSFTAAMDGTECTMMQFPAESHAFAAHLRENLVGLWPMPPQAAAVPNSLRPSELSSNHDTLCDQDDPVDTNGTVTPVPEAEEQKSSSELVELVTRQIADIFVVALALIPPALSMVIGLTFAWVFRGFRQ
jgi:hypothetical protein